MKRLVCIALLLASCDDRPMENTPETLGGAAGEAMTAAGGIGGQVGAAAVGGQGGIMETPISKVFVRDDRFLCADWPVCPEGVISPAKQVARVVFTWCSMQNAKMNCGPCMDTRTPTCAPFVGRCKAPNWPVDRAPAFCADQIATPRNVVDAFTICTGDTNAVGPDGVAGSDALTVCGDP
jgi:hypothetical protein